VSYHNAEYRNSYWRDYENDADSSEGREQESRKVVKTVTARKARPALGIKVGDRVKVTSWFTYTERGPRTGYHHEYRKVR